MSLVSGSHKHDHHLWAGMSSMHGGLGYVGNSVGDFANSLQEQMFVQAMNKTMQVAAHVCTQALIQ